MRTSLARLPGWKAARSAAKSEAPFRFLADRLRADTWSWCRPRASCKRGAPVAGERQIFHREIRVQGRGHGNKDHFRSHWLPQGAGRTLGHRLEGTLLGFAGALFRRISAAPATVKLPLD